jgi:ribosomal subunit interface protein
MANFKTNIKATNYELTTEIREIIEQKTAHFEKFMPVGADEEVIMNVEVGKITDHHHQGLIYRAEFNIKYKGQFKRSESTQENLRAAIEIASDELTRQIRKTKERRKDLIKQGADRVKKWLRFGR